MTFIKRTAPWHRICYSLQGSLFIRVIMRGEKIVIRRGALKVDITMERENGEVVCVGKLAGMGVDK